MVVAGVWIVEAGVVIVVVPAANDASVCVALRRQHGFHRRKLARDALAMENSITANDNRCRQARLRLRELPDADSKLWLRASAVTY